MRLGACMNNDLSPLHIAVIQSDLSIVQELKDSEWSHAVDALGFSPYELAKLLGKKDCQRIFAEDSEPLLKVRIKGEEHFSPMKTSQFEQFFQVIYRPSLVFKSYSDLEDTIARCPLLFRWKWSSYENHQLAHYHQRELNSGASAKIYLKWIDETLGYGVFLDEDLPANAFIGEYTGVVKQLAKRERDENAYCYEYPTRILSSGSFAIDALNEGNWTRFINHSIKSNLHAVYLIDRQLLHLVFFAKHPIVRGTQLTIDYGKDYWKNRPMVPNL